jgi:hypothetical protein
MGGHGEGRSSYIANFVTGRAVGDWQSSQDRKGGLGWNIFFANFFTAHYEALSVI